MSVRLTELLERCQRSEHEAIVMLVTRFQAWALDFAASLLHDSSKWASSEAITPTWKDAKDFFLDKWSLIECG